MNIKRILTYLRSCRPQDLSTSLPQTPLRRCGAPLLFEIELLLVSSFEETYSGTHCGAGEPFSRSASSESEPLSIVHAHVPSAFAPQHCTSWTKRPNGCGPSPPPPHGRRLPHRCWVNSQALKARHLPIGCLSFQPWPGSRSSGRNAMASASRAPKSVTTVTGGLGLKTRLPFCTPVATPCDR